MERHMNKYIENDASSDPNVCGMHTQCGEISNQLIGLCETCLRFDKFN